MTKLRVDLKNGFLEVEGEETFVREVYGDYKDVLALVSAKAAEVKDSSVPELSSETNPPDATIAKAHPRRAKSGTKSKESHRIVGSLNLAQDRKKSLRDFVAEKAPGTGMEVNTVAVYYLQKILGIEGITPDHIYTCYKEIERKVPTALLQNLWDTASLKSWIDTSDKANIRITTAGENLVEHSLPRKKGAGAK